MSTMLVPAYSDTEEEEWATLGPAICDWIEAFLVFGPGDLRAMPAKLDAEKRALIYRAYQVYPQGHLTAGRRRFRRVAFSLRKGSAKSELAAWLAACELHPDAPVRCSGFNGQGMPTGHGVTDPYVALIAYTEEQSDELAYAALRCCLAEGPLLKDFDVGLTRIIRKDGTGRAVSLATAPDARDGARTTFQVADESHRLVMPRQKEAWRTMLANLLKRPMADPWALEITTAYGPGEGSVAETTHDYARQVEGGRLTDSRLFYFHRQANDGHLLNTREDITQAVMEASGPVAAWSDVPGIVDQFFEPDADLTYLERVWLNRPVRTAYRAFDAAQWLTLAQDDGVPPDGTVITLGFDGSRNDSTALVGTSVLTGYQWLVGLWERPANLAHDADWEVPEQEVDQAVEACCERWDVWRMYADPPYWETRIAAWAGRHGDDKIVEWPTNRQRPWAYAIRGFANAVANGDLSHSGDQRLTHHVGSAVRRNLTLNDDDGKPLWVIQKERPDSPHRIDAVSAAVLSWEARTDAVTKGVGNEPSMVIVGAVEWL